MRASTSKFSESTQQLSEWAKALSHPARIAILQILSERADCVCGDIVQDLPLAQSTVSQHLRVLKDAGLIQGTVDGPRVCYCLNPDALNAAQESLGKFFRDLDAAVESCC